MLPNTDEILDAIRADVAHESRRGQRPVLVRLGSEIRARLAVAKDADGHALVINGPGEQTILGIPVGDEPAIDPDGIAIEYEPKP